MGQPRLPSVTDGFGSRSHSVGMQVPTHALLHAAHSDQKTPNNNEHGKPQPEVNVSSCDHQTVLCSRQESANPTDSRVIWNRQCGVPNSRRKHLYAWLPADHKPNS